jgi:hypothetical protein
VKNPVRSLPNTFLVLLGRPLRGHHHDYSLFKQAFPPALDGFTDINIRVDWGYLGMPSDSHGERIAIPTTQPRKSQKHPHPPWSDAQKVAKKVLSPVRICIEPAIGGMKRYTILVHGFRNRKADFEDDALGVCAGLWNFVLSC